jgi:hypothetical protein
MATKHADTDAIAQLSNEDIQRTFTNGIYPKVLCTIDYFFGHQVIRRVFSLPFKFPHLRDITRHFPDMIFDTVTHLTIKDKVGFRDEFFFRLARCFPSVEHLRICNILRPPLDNVDKRHRPDGHWPSLLQYPQLISLDVEECNEHYTEHFLNDAKTQLPRLLELRILPFVLEIVTTRNNCAKVKRLLVKDLPLNSHDVRDYFPSLAT